MIRALLFVACALVAGTAASAQPEIARPSGSTQPEIARSAKSAQPENTRPAKSTQPLGRLFFTPDERAQLDVARTQKKPTQLASTEEAPPAAPPPPQIVTYGGIVRRSDGRAMLWINNQLVDEKDALSALNVKGRVRADGAVTIQVPQSTATIDVKVGQSVEVHSGKVAETRRADPEAKAPPSDAKPSASDAKPSAVDAKPPAADGKPPVADAKSSAQAAKPGEPESADRKGDSGAGVGLKMDLGGRRLEPAESQRITGK